MAADRITPSPAGDLDRRGTHAHIRTHLVRHSRHLLVSGCATHAQKEKAYDVATESQTAEVRVTGTRIKRRIRTDGSDPGLGMPVEIVTKEQMNENGVRSWGGIGN